MWGDEVQGSEEEGSKLGTFRLLTYQALWLSREDVNAARRAEDFVDVCERLD